MKPAQIYREQWLDWLQHESHLRGLDRDEYRLLSGVLHPMHLNEGDFLFETGENNREIFLIRNGHVEVGRARRKHHWIDLGPYGEVDLTEDAGGKEELQDKIVLGPGDCVGENGLFINHAHALTAIAAEEGEVLCLNACKIPDICSGTPHVAQCISDLLQRDLRHIKLEA